MSRLIIHNLFSGGIVYYSVGISSSLLYFRIAYKWNELLQLCKEVDDIFCTGLYTLSGWSLKKQIWFTLLIMMIFATIEHLLFWYSFMTYLYMQVKDCNWEIESWFYYIFSLQFENIFKVFPMNPISIIWAEYMNISFTFAWNYIDLFIMVMSLSISTKFKMLNERLNDFKGRVSSRIFQFPVHSIYPSLLDSNRYLLGCYQVPLHQNLRAQ